MRNDDRVRVAHMVDAAKSIAQFIAGRQRSDLDEDQMLLFAVVRAIEVLGEAASRMSEEARSQSPHIRWRSIISMRNRLVHEYFDIDPEIVWKTATAEIPLLLPSLQALAEERE